MSRYLIAQIEPHEADWDGIESCPDCTVFHTRQWDHYLSTIGRNHFILSISTTTTPTSCIGFFVATIRNFGIKLIGSPDGGSGTYVQGLCMKEEVSADERMAIYQDIIAFVFENRLASYIQVSDWSLSSHSIEWIPQPSYTFSFPTTKGFHQNLRSTLFIDTSLPEEQLWANLKYKSCKYCINKARKLGLHIKVVDRREEIPEFVDTLSALIQDVSRRKHERRHVHHSKKYLMALCQSLFPNRVLMLQVLGTTDNGTEQVMASSVFCIGPSVSTYFSGASNEEYMKYCPNELMIWEGMRILHKHGSRDLILGGIASYKKKYGSSYSFLPIMVFSRYRILDNMRTSLKRIYKAIRQKK